MGTTNLRAVKVYLTEEEYKKMREDAENETSLSNWIRYHLKLPLLRQGAPKGNKNRAKQQTTKKRKKK